jgi:hypothetical protein
MFSQKHFVLSAALFLLLSVPARPAFPPVDLSGTWTGLWDTEDAVGEDYLTVALVKAGSTYTGTIADSLNFIPNGSQITDVKVEGAGIGFSFAMIFVGDRRDEIRIEATWDGEKMKGVLRFTAKGAEVPFEMRKKEGKKN